MVHISSLYMLASLRNVWLKRVHLSRLVATLGSRSITKKLNKKAILDVDVPRACNVITNPEAPMALRLQGSLL